MARSNIVLHNIYEQFSQTYLRMTFSSSRGFQSISIITNSMKITSWQGQYHPIFTVLLFSLLKNNEHYCHISKTQTPLSTGGIDVWTPCQWKVLFWAAANDLGK